MTNPKPVRRWNIVAALVLIGVPVSVALWCTIVMFGAKIVEWLQYFFGSK